MKLGWETWGCRSQMLAGRRMGVLFIIAAFSALSESYTGVVSREIISKVKVARKMRMLIIMTKFRRVPGLP